MISVMIVEDEPPISRDLKKLIKSIDSEFEIIACANNGYEAKAFLASLIPDVIFTDIHMPVIDGLELISYLREKKMDCEIVILSGYSEFSYAQKALQLHVNDYLLKPIRKELLETLLSKLRLSVSDKKKRLQQSYLDHLFKQKPFSCDFPIFNKFNYYVMLLCAGSFPINTLDYYSPRKFFWDDLNFEHTFSSLFPHDNNLWIIDGKTVAEKVIIFSSFDATLDTSNKILNITTQYFKNSILPITGVLSKATTNINDTGPLFKELRSIINKTLILGYSKFLNLNALSSAAIDTSTELLPIDSSTCSRLSQLIQKGRKNAFRQELEHLVQYWDKHRYPQIWVDKLLRKIITLFQDFVTNLEALNLVELDLQLSDVFAATNSYSTLLDNCWYIFENLFQLRSNNFSHDESIELVMLRIDKYIVSHADEFISAQTLSDMVGLVPSYLCKLFRDYKGMSPSEYMVHLRIEKAKELIAKDPSILAKDLALIIGYSDPLYFSKIFKKKTGMSLSSYKKKMQF